VRSLKKAVDRVVRNENCTGCGACALISDRITVSVDASGFNRPHVDEARESADERAETRAFRAVCPGVRLTAPTPESDSVHPTFGRYVSAWHGVAADEQIRHAGSSAGVLTALSQWLVDTGRTASVVGSTQSTTDPLQTQVSRLTTSGEILSAAGSRYAPVGNASLYSTDAGTNAMVGKPCEASAVSQLHDHVGTPPADRPVILSFFCAGVPRLDATVKLAGSLGYETADVRAVRYRGQGWPGSFTVTGRDDSEASLSYEESWGQHLGRDLQWRCKICPDGTGAHADISVGDYWAADDQGYPIFTNSEGASAVIARTWRGHQLLERAAADGVIVVQPVDLDDVARVQPLQVKRRQVLGGRLAGRMLGGRRVPRYRGYGIVRSMIRMPSANARDARGTLRRTLSRFKHRFVRPRS